MRISILTSGAAIKKAKVFIGKIYKRGNYL